MKVLISAYACEPGRGSEPEAGWQWLLAAARNNTVWVMTHATNEQAVTRALADEELTAQVHPVFLRAPRWARPLRRRGSTRFLYYVIWQLFACRRAALALHADIGFDVAHHVTYAADWAPSGLAGLDVPFVWGPVGGASTPSHPRLWRRLGRTALLGEAVRFVLLGIALRTCGAATAARAAVVVGQNADVAEAFVRTEVVVEPNIALADTDTPLTRETRRADAPCAVFAGRLLGWKGLDLALDALERAGSSSWRLDVYGDGPHRSRLESRAAESTLTDRVRFHGQRPRPEVLAALAGADAFLFPSLHDSAGWSAAEAMAAGCPVVALDTGGPRTVVGPTDGVLVDPRSPTVVDDLAQALDKAAGMRPRTDRWSAARLAAAVDALYQRALEAPRSRA